MVIEYYNFHTGKYTKMECKTFKEFEAYQEKTFGIHGRMKVQVKIFITNKPLLYRMQYFVK